MRKATCELWLLSNPKGGSVSRLDTPSGRFFCLNNLIKIQPRAHRKESKNAVVVRPDGYIEVYRTQALTKNLINKAIVGLLVGYLDMIVRRNT